MHGKSNCDSLATGDHWDDWTSFLTILTQTSAWPIAFCGMSRPLFMCILMDLAPRPTHIWMPFVASMFCQGFILAYLLIIWYFDCCKLLMLRIIRLDVLDNQFS